MVLKPSVEKKYRDSTCFQAAGREAERGNEGKHEYWNNFEQLPIMLRRHAGRPEELPKTERKY